MKKGLKGIIFLLLISNYSIAQEENPVDSVSNENFLAMNTLQEDTLSIPSLNQEDIFMLNPTVGLGIGMFSFFGDIYDKNFQSPTVSRIAYDLSVSHTINENFILTFNVLFGKLGANERLAANNRNLNFESQIRAGGINIAYNFGHFLPKSRKATPYISLGIESFEFLSKTDALDENGNEYFYWTDGTIRNIDQNASDANTAVEIKRDYIYESDIREMDLDGFGKYAERSFAIPVGLGILFEINDYIDFKFGTAMHFTFTDYIDGVTFTSKGNRQGNNKNDKFMMTSCAISYNFGSNKKASEFIDNSQYSGIDFMAIDSSDYDGDGVVDLRDSCQGTPLGEIVDVKGCPTDSDQDNYPNFKDDEINSPPNAFVDVKGVQMSDSLIEDHYLKYLNPSLNLLDFNIYRVHKGVATTLDPNQKVYSVDLGTYTKGLPADVMTKFLAVKDISTKNIDKSTTNYSAGKFTSLDDAKIRQQQLIEAGLGNAKIVYTQNGKVVDVDASEPPVEATTPATGETIADKTEEPIANELPIAKIKEPAATKAVRNIPSTTSDVFVTDTRSEEQNLELVKAIENLAAKIENVQANLETLSAKVEKSNDAETAPKPVVVKEVGLKTDSDAEMENMVKELSEKLDAIQASIEQNKTVIETSVENNMEQEDDSEMENKVNQLVSEIEEMKTSLANVNKLKAEEGKNIAKVVEKEKPTAISSPVSPKQNSQKPVVTAFNAEALQKAYTDINPANAKPNNNLPSIEKEGNSIKPSLKTTGKETTANSSINTDGVVLRVQLGAYNKPISKKAFKGVDDLIEIKTEDGLYKYLTGSFNSFEDAAKHKLNMVLNGYQGAFITAYKNGERISLKEAGATPATKDDLIDTPDHQQSNSVNKELVQFKVQIGVYQNQPPNEKLEVFAKIKDITGEKTKSGLTRYVVGSYNNYEEAVASKDRIVNNFGLRDAFIVALFNNEYISIQEAIELLK